MRAFTHRLFLLTFLLLGLIIASGCSSAVPIPDWTDITWGPFSLADPPGVTNPVLRSSDVTDRNARFLADPFLFKDQDRWYMFFEVYDNDTFQGDIGLATSSDGLHWQYDRIVLDEEFHLSYPDVFKYQGVYYMLPETHQLKEIRLYKAVEFPYKWQYLATLASGRSFVDPSIFYYKARWWMYVGDADNTTLYLYSSPVLTRSWMEHPQSPISADEGLRSRPAGRPIVLNDNVIIRFAQGSAFNGQQVSAFQVDKLDALQYADHEISASPLLVPSPDPTSWYSRGMHHFNPWWVGDHWLVAYDGKDARDVYSIGLKVATAPIP